MRGLAKKAIGSLGQRSIATMWVANFVYFVSSACRSLPSRYKSGPLYRSVHPIGTTMAGITPGATANTADSPVNFFVRCALEDDYTYLIEIGAFGGQRAARLA